MKMYIHKQDGSAIVSLLSQHLNTSVSLNIFLTARVYITHSFYVGRLLHRTLIITVKRAYYNKIVHRSHFFYTPV